MTSLIVKKIKNHIRGWNMQGWEAHEIGEDLAMYQQALNDVMAIIENEEMLENLNKAEYKGSVIDD